VKQPTTAMLHHIIYMQI